MATKIHGKGRGFNFFSEVPVPLGNVVPARVNRKNPAAITKGSLIDIAFQRIGPMAVPTPKQVCSAVIAVEGRFGKSEATKGFRLVIFAPNPAPKNAIAKSKILNLSTRIARTLFKHRS